MYILPPCPPRADESLSVEAALYSTDCTTSGLAKVSVYTYKAMRVLRILLIGRRGVWKRKSELVVTAQLSEKLG